MDSTSPVGIIIILFIILVIAFSCKKLLHYLEFYNYTLRYTRRLKSSIDGKEYKVHLSHDHAEEAADMLAIINISIIDLMKFFRSNDYTPNQAKFTENILARYDYDRLVENSPYDPNGDTSYTINKGRTLALCLRDESAQLHNTDLIMFVMLHEITHIGLDQNGHNPKFWKAFKFILQEAKKAVGYHSPNYRNNPTNYCGLDLKYNPYYDDHLPALK